MNISLGSPEGYEKDGINLLIQDAMRHPFEGIGKIAPLRENLSGFWSRRIDDAHRLVYTVQADTLVIIACRYHYD